jgi:hypothetical protein
MSGVTSDNDTFSNDSSADDVNIFGGNFNIS